MDQFRGPILGTTGTQVPLTASYDGSQRNNDAHGRFMDAVLNNRLFAFGAGLTAINNATFTTGTIGVTATPIVGVWNPLNSGKYLSILQAYLGLTMTALIATGGGPFAWMVSVSNAVISTGSNPFSQLSLAQTGSVAKAFAGGIALTGLTNNLAVMRASSLFGGSASDISFTATAAGMQTQQQSSVENIDGGIIVPPGAVLVLMATTTPVAHSAVSGLVWEEIPILP